MNKIRIWKEGYWRTMKAGNRVWVKGKFKLIDKKALINVEELSGGKEDERK